MITIPELGISWSVEKFPDRKRYALCRTLRNNIYPMAYFKREQDALDFNDFLNCIKSIDANYFTSGETK